MEEITGYIDKNKERIIALTKALVNIPTINPPGQRYEQLVDFLESRCKSMGLETRRYIVPKREWKNLGISGGSSRINLVARWNACRKKTLHINGHYDVVPATGAWATDPFKAVVRDGKLFGRGSEDMKANIACALSAVAVLKKLHIPPAVNIELSFTPDEETGGNAGLAYLVKKNLVKADYVLGEGCEGDYVAVGNKGMLWLEVEVRGTPAHSSTPYRGDNAFDYMTAIAGELRKLQKALARRKTCYAVRHPRDAYSTMVLGGVLSGGKKVNIVPDRVVFSIDRRLIPEESVAAARKEIEHSIKRVPRPSKNIRVCIRTITEETPVITPDNALFMRTFAQAAEAVRGRPVKTAIMPGGTDLRYFMRKGIPGLGYTVQGAERAHADNEFVYLRSIVDTTKIFALLMKNLG